MKPRIFLMKLTEQLWAVGIRKSFVESIYTFNIPANIYFFKVNNRTLEKGVKYVQS